MPDSAAAPRRVAGLPEIVAIVGATGTGKSELSLDLAEALAAEGTPCAIINADAMQLYRGMDIGTAKVPPEERRGIPHHLLDVLDVTDEASVAVYQRRVHDLAQSLRNEGRLPILVGGSGLYVSAALFDLSFPPTDDDVRRRLEEELEERGDGILHRRLAELDPAAAAALDPRNHRRLVRALEVIELTGEPFTATLPSPDPVVDTEVVALRMPREDLFERLDARVHSMWRAGLLDEVRRLEARGLRDSHTASQAIGYSQALAELDGSLTEAEAIEATQRATRRYAKRQESWFGRYEATWCEAGSPTLLDRARAAVTSRAR